MNAALLFLYAESPVHAGGAESTGGIDLPIQREAGTELPTIWGQSLKGALRETAREAGWSDDQGGEVERVFGSPPPTPGSGSSEVKPGALAVGDARLVAFPVPTLQRAFAWVASPLTLSRVARLARLASVQVPSLPSQRPAEGEVIPANVWSGTMVLGGYSLNAAAPAGRPPGAGGTSGSSGAVAAWAASLVSMALPQDASGAFTFFAEKLKTDLLYVTDDILQDLTHDCADVVARVQLHKHKKTVKEGPWYEENLPSETILVSLLRWVDDAVEKDLGPKLFSLLDGQVLNLGGDETVGRGLMWCRYITNQKVPKGKSEEEAGRAKA